MKPRLKRRAKENKEKSALSADNGATSFLCQVHGLQLVKIERGKPPFNKNLRKIVKKKPHKNRKKGA
jgi:hypothetical protein